MSDKNLQLVIFGLDNELYGVDTQTVIEILRMEDITPIPRTEDYIEGILNLRGQIIPVVCLRKRLGLASRVESKETRIIIVELENLRVGFIVDVVSEVINLTDAQVTKAPDMVAAEYVSGVCHYNNALVVVIELKQLFSEQLEAATAR